MANVKDRKTAIVDSIRALKVKSDDAGVLVAELEKVKKDLPESAKAPSKSTRKRKRVKSRD